jgi:hypothetical protein
MSLNLYLFGPMTLAAVSSCYKDSLKEDLKRILRVKRKKLETAFNLIKTRVSKNGEPIITGVSYNNFSKLIKLIDVKKSELKIKILFQVLDFSDENHLGSI